jgi:hypothetical protein
MIDKLQHLKTLLEQLQSTTKSVDEDGPTTPDEWAEVFSLIEELAAEKPSAGSAVIAEALKAILDKDFPGAQLNDAPLNGAGRLVVFEHKGNYFTVEIRE